MYLLLAWRDLWRNKRRTLITLAAIFFAVLLSCIMRSAQMGAYDNMIRNSVGHFVGYVQVHQAGYWDDRTLDNAFPSSDSLLRAVRAVEGVTDVAERLESFALAASRDQTNGALVVGFDPAHEPAIRNTADRITQGARLETIDEQAALLGKDLADRLGLGVSDSVVLLGSGYHGSFAAGKYRVKGLIDLGSPDLNKRAVFLPLGTARQLYGADDLATSLVIGTDRPGDATAIADAIRRGTDGHRWEVMDWKQLVPELVQFIEVDNSFALITLAILYIVIAFGIFGTLLMMYTERIHEFGVMTAVGMGRGRLATVFVLGSAIMALLGALLGGLTAMPVVMYFQANPIRFTGELAQVYETYGFEPIIPFMNDPWIFAAQAAIVLGITLFLRLYPTLKILRLVPIRALRA